MYGFLCRHERTAHPGQKPVETTNSKPSGSREAKSDVDHIYNYHTARLQFGLVHLYIRDAIHEGDGQRLLLVLPYALLLFHKYKRTKYAYVTLLHLVKIYALLPSGLAHELVHERFWNSKGGKGRNIPLDLRMEHMVRLFKLSLKQMGANINHVGAQRIAQSLGHLEELIRSVDKDCEIEKASGYHSSKHLKEVVLQVVNDLKSADVFEFEAGRRHPSFPDFPQNILEKLDFTELYAWISRLLKIWGAIYE